METAAPFDLNRAIQQWRENLAPSPAFRRENLDELESHLRDSVTHLMQRGLAADEAFLVATRRVGGGPMLSREFSKMNAKEIWMNRALWMLVGIQVLGLVHSLVYIITEGTVLGLKPVMTPDNGSSTELYGILLGLVHMIVFAVVLTFGWRLLTRKCNNLSAWSGKMPKRASHQIAIAAVCLIALLLLGTIPTAGNALLIRYGGLHHPLDLFSITSFGTAIASPMEALALMIMTFWLARRQLLAKI
jgi:uncharacterized membrane protein YbhN (UPF0104 family)